MMSDKNYVMGIRGEKVDEDKVYSSCPNCAALRAEVADLKQQVANMEEYVLKGVAFRDELQAALIRHWHKIP